MLRRQFLTGLLATPLIVPASRLMALPRRTWTSSVADIGLREELSQLIESVSPSETPFFAKYGKISIRDTAGDWLIDDRTLKL